MKYNLNINQKRALELGITSINQALIFDLLSCSQVWATPEILNEEVYYWVARQKICEELEILNLKPDTVYRHLKSLNELNLIDYEKKGKKDLIKITKLGKSYYVGNRSELPKNSEIDPEEFGNRSEFNSDLNPTYKDTNIIITTNNKTYKKENSKNHIVEQNEMVSAESKIPSESDSLVVDKCFEDIWIEYSKYCKKQNRRPGNKKKSKTKYRSLYKTFLLSEIDPAIIYYSEDCLIRNIYLKNLENFLNKDSIEEWLNGSENHQALLELKSKPVNISKNSHKFENKQERIEREVSDYGDMVSSVLSDVFKNVEIQEDQSKTKLIN